MKYQWNPDKARANYKKHGIYFSDAVSVFSDDFAMTNKDDYLCEERFVTIGMDAFGKIIVVVFTWRDDDIRIISARKATQRESNQYFGDKK